MLALALVSLQDAFVESRRVALALVLLSGWGVLFSAWLTWLELFVIRAICTWCVISAAIVVVLFGASVWEWRSGTRDEGRGTRDEGRGTRGDSDSEAS